MLSALFCTTLSLIFFHLLRCPLLFCTPLEVFPSLLHLPFPPLSLAHTIFAICSLLHTITVIILHICMTRRAIRTQTLSFFLSIFFRHVCRRLSFKRMHVFVLTFGCFTIGKAKRYLNYNLK